QLSQYGYPSTSQDACNYQVIHTPSATIACAANSEEKVLRPSMESTLDVAAVAKVRKLLGERLLFSGSPADEMQKIVITPTWRCAGQRHHHRDLLLCNDARDEEFGLSSQGLNNQGMSYAHPRTIQVRMPDGGKREQEDGLVKQQRIRVRDTCSRSCLCQKAGPRWGVKLEYDGFLAEIYLQRDHVWSRGSKAVLGRQRLDGHDHVL
ncbi:hypothetical protein EJB05_05053, partial [Eragrostis curvula]